MKALRNNKNSWYLVLILVVFSVLPNIVEADGASLYLSPGSGTFFVGSTFDVSVFVDICLLDYIYIWTKTMSHNK